MRQIKVEKNVGGIKGLCVVTPAVHGYSRGLKKQFLIPREVAHGFLVLRVIAWKMA